MTLPENVKMCLEERKYNVSLVRTRDGEHSAMYINEEFNQKIGLVNICTFTAERTPNGVRIWKSGGFIDHRLEEYIRENISRITFKKDANAFYDAFLELADKSGRF